MQEQENNMQEKENDTQVLSDSNKKTSANKEVPRWVVWVCLIIFFLIVNSIIQEDKLDRLFVGCDSGNAEACNILGDYYQYGYGSVVKRDYDMAKKLYQEACRLGYKPACK